MNWKNAPDWLVETFDRIFPLHPQADRKLMFTFPIGLVNDHMFAGLFEDNMFFRLNDRDRAEFLTVPGAAPFSPLPDRPTREYVVAPPEMLEDLESLRIWVDRAFSHAASLPLKPDKPRRAVAKKTPTNNGAPAKSAVKKLSPPKKAVAPKKPSPPKKPAPKATKKPAPKKLTKKPTKKQPSKTKAAPKKAAKARQKPVKKTTKRIVKKLVKKPVAKKATKRRR